MPDGHTSPGSYLTSTYSCLCNYISWQCMDCSKSGYCISMTTENIIMFAYIDNIYTILVQPFSYYDMNAFIPCSPITAVVMLLNFSYINCFTDCT